MGDVHNVLCSTTLFSSCRFMLWLLLWSQFIAYLVFEIDFIFSAIINGNVFSISGFVIMHRNTVGFVYWLCILQTYLLILVTFLVDCKKLSILTIMSPVNRDSFTSFFRIYLLFLFIFLIFLPFTLARTYRSGLNRSNICIVPDLRGKHSVFSHYDYQLKVFLWCPLASWGHSLYVWFSENFYQQSMLTILNPSYASIKIPYCF